MRKLLLSLLIPLMLLISLLTVHAEAEGYNYPKLDGALGHLMSFKNGWNPLYRFTTFDNDLLRLDGGLLKKGKKEKFWELHHLDTGLAYFTAGDVRGGKISVEWKDFLLIRISGEPWGAVCNSDSTLAQVASEFPELRSLVLNFCACFDTIESIRKLSKLKYLAIQDCWCPPDFESILADVSLDYVELMNKDRDFSVAFQNAVGARYLDVKVLTEKDSKDYLSIAKKALQVRVLWGVELELPEIGELAPESLDSFVLYLKKCESFEAAIDLLSGAKHLKHIGLHDYHEKSYEERKLLIVDLSKLAFAYSVELGGEEDYGSINWSWKSRMSLKSKPAKCNIQALTIGRCGLDWVSIGEAALREFRIHTIAVPPSADCLPALQEVEDLYISCLAKGSAPKDLGKLPKVKHIYSLDSCFEYGSVHCNPEVFFTDEKIFFPDGLKIRGEFTVVESRSRKDSLGTDPFKCIRKQKKGTVPFVVCYGYDEKRDGELPEIFDVAVVSATEGKYVQDLFHPFPSKILGKPWGK